jgi:hypothetical protein
VLPRQCVACLGAVPHIAACVGVACADVAPRSVACLGTTLAVPTRHCCLDHATLIVLRSQWCLANSSI